jgi:hypothetical protein
VIRDELAVGVTNPRPQRMLGDVAVHFLDIVNSLMRQRMHLAS